MKKVGSQFAKIRVNKMTDCKYYATFRIDPEEAWDTLKNIFPTGEADELNLIFFATSGIHGSYTTIEQIENLFEDREQREDYGDQWNYLTFVILKPRIVQTLYGNLPIESAQQIEFVKQLQKSMRRE